MAVMRFLAPARGAGEAVLGGGGGGGEPAATVQAAAPDPAATEVAARPLITLGSALAVGVGWIGVLLLNGLSPDRLPAPLKVSGDFMTFALFYVAAQAIERAIEPFSNLILATDKIRKELDHLVATAVRAADTTAAAAAAAKQDELNKARGERALVLWAAASILGMVVSGFTGLYFVGAMLAEGSSFNRALDVLITGLVVGGGSKPLHDLITKVQKSKEKAEDPPETNP
jgi:hypothetical protein